MKKSLMIVLTFLMTTSIIYASTLSDVKKRGMLRCGVSNGLPGFSYAGTNGKWKGLDVDTCRAVAAAVLGSAKKVKFVSLTSKERFTALSSGEIDVLSRNTTWTLTRDASLGINFAGVNYYDGQGFLVKKSLGVKSATQLDGASVCIQAGTTSELNINDYFKSNNMRYKAITSDTSHQTVVGFEAGRCDMITSDQSQLYALRSKMKNPSSAIVLPEVISKEPLGPVVKQGDDQWFNIVKWTMFALLEAEESGVTAKNAYKMKKSKNPTIRRLLGTEGDGGKNLGIRKDWAYQAISQVGNYEEIFNRNVGPNTALAISRGNNALWKNGGLMYPMPIR